MFGQKTKPDKTFKEVFNIEDDSDFGIGFYKLGAINGKFVPLIPSEENSSAAWYTSVSAGLSVY